MIVSSYLADINFLFRLDNSEVYVLSGQDIRHLCGTVDVKSSNNDVYVVNCNGAIGIQVEITTTYVDADDKRAYIDYGGCDYGGFYGECDPNPNPYRNPYPHPYHRHNPYPNPNPYHNPYPYLYP